MCWSAEGPRLTQRSPMQEVLPCLLRVLCRPLRAVAPNIFTAAERAVMAELVSLLLTHGLTFDMAADGGRDSEPLMLRPEVHRLCSFPVSASCFQTQQLCWTRWQMISFFVSMYCTCGSGDLWSWLGTALPHLLMQYAVELRVLRNYLSSQQHLSSPRHDALGLRVHW